MAVAASDIGSYCTNNRSLETDPTNCLYPRSNVPLDSYYENYPTNPPPAYQPYTITDTGYCTSVDIYALPPLQPSSIETSQAHSSQIDRQRYSTANGATAASFTGSEVYSCHSSDKSNQVLYHFGEEEVLARRVSPTEVSNSHQQLKMGSGSSVLPASSSKKSSQKQRLKHRRNSTSSSDNGGFDSGTPKPALGVKEKLRYSLDKLSLKSPFKWNSSDKLTRSNSSACSKSKSKNNRRYSDSSTSLVDSNKDKKISQKKKSSKSGTWKNDKNFVLTSRKAHTLSTGRNESELEFEHRTFSSGNHDYVNLAAVSSRLLKTHPQTSNHNSTRYTQDSVFDPYDGRVANEYCALQNSQTHHDASALPYHQLWENKDTATRAKGTWKMLKTAKSNHLPIKAGSFPLYTSFLSDPSDALRHENTRTGHTVEISSIPEEIRPSEPPKLAPVSGKLLLDEKSSNMIVRPTAFRPIASPPSQGSSQSPENRTLEMTNAHPSRNDVYSGLKERERSISSESNISDSGRHSATSIPADTAVGGSLSCSGSEGYESARVSSSTTQSAMQEHEYNVDSTSSSSKRITDGVRISDLESRVKQKQDQVQSLRKNLEENEKALHDVVYDDHDQIREAVDLELDQKYPDHPKSQTRKASLQSQQHAERQYRLMHEEQKQLLDTTMEFQDRIKLMTDAIDVQSHQDNDVTDLRSRLEESELEIQQKQGEIFLLKCQVKEKQADLTQRSSEAVALKSYNRNLCAKLIQRDSQAAALRAGLGKRDREITELERRLAAASSRNPAPSVENLGLQNGQDNAMDPIKELSENSSEVSLFSDYDRDDQNYLTPSSPFVLCDNEKRITAFSLEEREELLKRLHAAERRCVAQEKQFEREKQQWAADKFRVIKYQKQLQGNYIQMYKRSHALEREVKMLSSRLRAVGVNAAVGPRVSENYSEQHDLSYPMEI